MREAGVTLTAAGPPLALVVASIVSRLADEKLPKLERSTTTVRGSPLPLLSVLE
jgi:hypothetical protein